MKVVNTLRAKLLLWLMLRRLASVYGPNAPKQMAAPTVAPAKLSPELDEMLKRWEQAYAVSPAMVAGE